MNLNIIVTFWNCENNIEECLTSIKTQYYTNFTAYIIDDMSTDSSYEIAKKTINGDKRFNLIKNQRKKFKCESYIDTIKNNEKIKDNDVIVEIDGDDKLENNFVLGLINRIFMDENVWVCGSKWISNNQNNSSQKVIDFNDLRKNEWNFNSLRTYRVFLFKSIKDEDLKYEDNYVQTSVDIAFGLPILEMAGDEHFYFCDEITYQYNFHKNQSHSNLAAHRNHLLKSQTEKHLRSLSKYGKLLIPKTTTLIPEIPSKADFIAKLTNNDNVRTQVPQKNRVKYEVVNNVTQNRLNQKSQYLNAMMKTNLIPRKHFNQPVDRKRF